MRAVGTAALFRALLSTPLCVNSFNSCFLCAGFVGSDALSVFFTAVSVGWGTKGC